MSTITNAFDSNETCAVLQYHQRFQAVYRGVEVRYISTEHPAVTYINTKHLKYANLTSQRYGRANPFYYVGLHFDTLVQMDNNVAVDFYFYEYLSNVYKRGFIEMHFRFCDLIHKDKFFGAPMRQGPFLKPCPYPPGDYHLYNMSIDVRVIPPGFPFRKGRIYANLTLMKTKEDFASGYINMEIKEITVKERSSKNIVKRLNQTNFS